MKIQTILDIDAPASAVWQVLGEQFGEVAEWSTTIEKSSLDRPLGEGAVRTCDIKAFGPVPAGQITEELTRFDRSSRSLTFVVRSGIPGFMRFVENAWTVEALDDGRSRATSRARFDLAWWMVPLSPLLRMQLARGIRSFVGELETIAIGAPEHASTADAMAS